MKNLLGFCSEKEIKWFMALLSQKATPMMQLIRKQSCCFLYDVCNNVFVPSESLCVVVQRQ